eukprot:GHVO01010624.1.p1 GENE.GHVO01010624.1~~GHVO01010624.1.p1  ORF type:complete len:522 (+),score=79.09 GHVO01010624.1:222-1787(+)
MYDPWAVDASALSYMRACRGMTYDRVDLLRYRIRGTGHLLIELADRQEGPQPTLRIFHNLTPIAERTTPNGSSSKKKKSKPRLHSMQATKNAVAVQATKDAVAVQATKDAVSVDGGEDAVGVDGGKNVVGVDGGEDAVGVDENSVDTNASTLPDPSYTRGENAPNTRVSDCDIYERFVRDFRNMKARYLLVVWEKWEKNLEWCEWGSLLTRLIAEIKSTRRSVEDVSFYDTVVGLVSENLNPTGCTGQQTIKTLKEELIRTHSESGKQNSVSNKTKRDAPLYKPPTKTQAPHKDNYQPDSPNVASANWLIKQINEAIFMSADAARDLIRYILDPSHPLTRFSDELRSKVFKALRRRAEDLYVCADPLVLRRGKGVLESFGTVGVGFDIEERKEITAIVQWLINPAEDSPPSDDDTPSAHERSHPSESSPIELFEQEKSRTLRMMKGTEGLVFRADELAELDAIMEEDPTPNTNDELRAKIQMYNDILRCIEGWEKGDMNERKTKRTVLSYLRHHGMWYTTE